MVKRSKQNGETIQINGKTIQINGKTIQINGKTIIPKANKHSLQIPSFPVLVSYPIQ